MSNNITIRFKSSSPIVKFEDIKDSNYFMFNNNIFRKTYKYRSSDGWETNAYEIFAGAKTLFEPDRIVSPIKKIEVSVELL